MHPRATVVRVRRLSPVFAVGLAAVALPSRAFAQERLHFERLDDEQLDDMTLPRGHHDDPWRFRAFGTVGGDGRTGLSSGAVASTAAGFGLGLRSDAAHFLALRSEAVLPDASSVGGGSFGFRDVEGFHRLRASYAFGSRTEKEVGADVSLDASAAHATLLSTSFLRPDIGPHPFLDTQAQATLWPRFGLTDEFGWVLPVTAGARRVDVDTGGATAGFTSTRVSSGIGMRSYRKESNTGLLELAGLSYEKARFVNVSSTAEKVELRGLSARHFVQVEDHIQFDIESEIGGAWVWDAVNERQTSTVSGRFGGVVRAYEDDETDWFELGIVAVRDAGWMADGSGLTRSWRIEMPAEISMLDDRIGGAVRVAAEDLEIPVGTPGGRDGWRATFTTEWYFAPTEGLQLGAHHATTNACAVAGDGYCHTIGAFVRLTGKAEPHRAQPSTPAEEEARSP